jgi:hypothetical protein
MTKRSKKPDGLAVGAKAQPEGAASAGNPRSGAEAVPPGTVEQHTSEHVSGYGGKVAGHPTTASQDPST